MTENIREPGPHPLPLFLAAVTRACAGDTARLARVLAGLRRYQQAPRPAPAPPRAAVAHAGGVSLRDYGRPPDSPSDSPPDSPPDSPRTARPLLVIPSIINGPEVLDLAHGNSLLDALAGAGLRPLLVDWGAIPPGNLATLVEDHLLPLLDALPDVCSGWQDRPVALAGYCLGGTMAMAVAQLRPHRIGRLGLLATPWTFSAYPPARRHDITAWWQRSQALVTSLGGVPIELLQPGFWGLDEAGLADKFARLASDGEHGDAAAMASFIRLEDWTNNGPPLPPDQAAALFEDLLGADMTGNGRWAVGGQIIDPSRLPCPTLDVVALRDQLVPPAATVSASHPHIERCTHDAGHVGMIVGRDAPSGSWQRLAAWLTA